MSGAGWRGRKFGGDRAREEHPINDWQPKFQLAVGRQLRDGI